MLQHTPLVLVTPTTPVKDNQREREILCQQPATLREAHFREPGSSSDVNAVLTLSLAQKNLKIPRVGGIARLTRHKTLGSIPSTTKERKNNSLKRLWRMEM